MKKTASRRTDKQQRNENSFASKLDDLFDIAHANALQMIKLEEDKAFLKVSERKLRKEDVGH